MDTVKAVKEKLSIVDVVSGYVKLERAGGSLRARCPFHAEKTPSFFVSPERGTYHCFGCGVGGDIFAFIEAIEGVDFKGALKILAERAGVPLVFGASDKKDVSDRMYQVLETATIFYQNKLDESARAYLTRRGLTAPTIQSFRIGYASDEWTALCDALKTKGYTEREIMDAGVAKKNERGVLSDKFRNRIMFPIADTAGRIVGFSGRTFGEKAHPDAPKYLNTPETPLFHKSKILYAFDRAKQAMRKHNFAILVEGQMDLLMSHEAGFANTVAVSGTAFTEEHAKLVKRMTENLLLALDSDEAGIKAATRAAHVALSHDLNVKVAALTAGKDPADLILEKGVEEWRTVVREAKDIVTFLLDVLEEKLSKRDQFRRAVESIVLPFLEDVRSPIAREQYVQEVAQRLRVSESAVRASLRAVPSATPVPAEQSHKKEPSLTDTLLALYVWQRNTKSPALDPEHMRSRIDAEVGSVVTEHAARLSDAEKESLCFEAERRHGRSADLSVEFASLIRRVKHESLSAQLKERTVELKRAEEEGKEQRVAELMSECNALRARIAKL